MDMRANPYLVPVRTPAKARGGSAQGSGIRASDDSPRCMHGTQTGFEIAEAALLLIAAQQAFHVKETVTRNATVMHDHVMNNENDYKRPNYARGHLHEVGMHAGRNFVNFLSGKGFESATRRQ